MGLHSSLHTSRRGIVCVPVHSTNATLHNMTIEVTDRMGNPAHFGRFHLWFKLLVTPLAPPTCAELASGTWSEHVSAGVSTYAPPTVGLTPPTQPQPIVTTHMTAPTFSWRPLRTSCPFMRTRRASIPHCSSPARLFGAADQCTHVRGSSHHIAIGSPTQCDLHRCPMAEKSPRARACFKHRRVRSARDDVWELSLLDLLLTLCLRGSGSHLDLRVEAFILARGSLGRLCGGGPLERRSGDHQLIAGRQARHCAE